MEKRKRIAPAGSEWLDASLFRDRFYVLTKASSPYLLRSRVLFRKKHYDFSLITNEDTVYITVKA